MLFYTTKYIAYKVEMGATNFIYYYVGIMCMVIQRKPPKLIWNAWPSKIRESLTSQSDLWKPEDDEFWWCPTACRSIFFVMMMVTWRLLKTWCVLGAQLSNQSASCLCHYKWHGNSFRQGHKDFQKTNVANGLTP